MSPPAAFPSTTLEGVDSAVRRALAAVPDPEIPACSIVDLGMVERVEVSERAVEVDLLPTFAGCPAKDVIGEDAARAVAAFAGGREVRVRFVLDPLWTTERITERGRLALAEYGIAPPGGPGPVLVPIRLRRAAAPVDCPYCGSGSTDLESAFGPTPCRTIHFCRACRNPFEGFKTK